MYIYICLNLKLAIWYCTLHNLFNLLLHKYNEMIIKHAYVHDVSRSNVHTFCMHKVICCIE